MRLPLFRLTVRRLMVAVFILALIFGLGIEWKRRRNRFRNIMFDHYYGTFNPFYSNSAVAHHDSRRFLNGARRLHFFQR
jgi:hypothetical protein